MEQSNLRNMRRSYAEGLHKPRPEPGVQASASTSVPSTTSSRPSHGTRTRSEPFITQPEPLKAKKDPRSNRASVPAARRQQGDSTPTQGTSTPHTAPPQLNFAVLGEEGSGKSTFVRCALDLKKPAISPKSSKKMSLEGDLFLISLVEVPMDEVEVVRDQIKWPGELEDMEMPHIDGVLLVCDATDRMSVKHIPKFLVTPPPSSTSSSRARATTTSSQFSNISHSYNTKVRHGRAASEVTQSTSRSVASGSLSPSTSDAGSQREPNTADSSGATPSNKHMSMHTSPSITSPTISEVSEDGTEEASNLEGVLAYQVNVAGHTSEIPLRPVTSLPLRNSNPLPDAYLEINSIESEDLEPSDAVLNPSLGETRQPYHGNQALGVSFDELVDRLLSAPMSKADSKFAAIFLCLYRKFAAPAQLLSGIICRFESLYNNGEPYLIRTASQLRHLSILAQWIEEYPGDFAHPVTRHQMSTFVAQLAANRVFAVAAKEMGAQIELASEDDDTDWACSDTSRGRASTLQSFSSVVSMRSSVSAMLAGDGSISGTTLGDNSQSEETSKPRVAKHSKASSSTSSGGRSGSHSAASFSIILSSLQEAQQQAELLAPQPRTPLTKETWHAFMEIGDEDIARELTRIDWILYRSVRPRDLVRHVSLSVEQKEKCRGLEHVNRMINQFNHVAFWVANMVLLRDKPKHRARMLEKFMSIAWKLRQMNNYNSLGAVIAGINGTAVHRLAQTRELVSQQAQKEFMRLEILMGTQKSHFAYRLAWENTTTERIPFLPLHRRDLVSAEEGNRTFVGENLDRINWKKFEIMGDVIVDVQKSQGTPYSNIGKNMEVQRLVLEGKFSKDDDELYERSIQLEGPSVGENTRKRFNWFQR